MVSKEVIQKHLEEIEYKYIACKTNINNIDVMLEDLEKEIETADEEQTKTLSVSKEQLIEQLRTNEKALVLHEHNITFLNKELGV